ncbi:MAG TPA: hypothetical protein VFX30_04450 [bacterium]|nr:hypothetical protein [bacterium]
MKIAGKNVEDPLAEEALEKLKRAGREVLSDDDVGTADEANRLLNVIKDGIVNERDFQSLNASLGTDQKLTREEFGALAREFQIRFPAAKHGPTFAGLSRFFAASPLKSAAPPRSQEEWLRTVEHQIEKASPRDLARAIMYVMGGVRLPPSGLDIGNIGSTKDRIRLANEAADRLLALLGKMSAKELKDFDASDSLKDIRNAVRNIRTFTPEGPNLFDRHYSPEIGDPLKAARHKDFTAHSE